MVRPPSPKTVVSRIFSASQRPIYLLDGDQKIIFCNQALSDWLGVPLAQLQNARCDYGATDGDSWLQRLAVPPQTLQHGEFRSTVSCRKTDGATSIRNACFYSLGNPPACTLVVVSDSESDERDAGAFDVARLHREAVEMRQAWSRCYRLDAIVGRSPAMQQVRTQIQLAAESNCRVVIVGNEGIGRETIARTIHHQRSRGSQMLVPLSCALLDVELLQVTVETLVKQIAELDNEDTSVLLLLEVDKLSLDAQSALLGFLEISEFGLETMATSSSRLHRLVEQKQFRPELAHHLSTLEIVVPPLRERLEDVPLLAQWMLEQSTAAQRLGGLTDAAQEALLRYHWPQEITELREVVEQAARKASSSMIEVTDLPTKIGFALEAAALPDREIEEIQLDAFLAEVETELICRAVRAAKGNRAQAARALGISRGKLLRRIEQLELDL